MIIITIIYLLIYLLKAIFNNFWKTSLPSYSAIKNVDAKINSISAIIYNAKANIVTKKHYFVKMH